MKPMPYSKNTLLPTLGAILALFILLSSFADNPPNGNTGAPFNDRCNNCHLGFNPNGYSGIVELSGLPGIVQPDSTYLLTLTMTPTGGSPLEAGFQMVAADVKNANAGVFQSVDVFTGVDFAGNRYYVEHREPKVFIGNNPVSWTFKWVAPAMAACNTITFYYVGNFCNGTGSGGDWSYYLNKTVQLSNPPLSGIPDTIQAPNCPNESNGTAKVMPLNGKAPYSYSWSNGQNAQQAIQLAAGNYTVTIADASPCSSILTILVPDGVDTLPPSINCPNGVTVCAGDTVVYADPMVIDNCDENPEPPVLLSGQNSNTIFPEGTSVVVFQSTDFAGNTSSCSFTVQVQNPPTITLDSIFNDIDTLGLGAIYVTADSTVSNYFWKKNNVFFSNQADLTGLSSGVYTLYVTNNLGCIDSIADINLINTVAIQGPGYQQETCSIRPNPAQRQIELYPVSHPIKSIQVFNQVGKAVSCWFKTTPNTAFIDIQHLIPGVYNLFVLFKNNQTQHFIFIKE